MSLNSFAAMVVAFVAMNAAMTRGQQCNPAQGQLLCFKSDQAAAYGVSEVVLDKYCKDNAKVTIVDSGFNNATGRLYVSFEGGDAFIGAMRQSKRSVFPLSLLGMRTGWAKYKADTKLKVQSLFTFEEGIFFREGYGYVGQNQAWMGCPISLCGVGGIDFLKYSYRFGGKAIHVGYHSWIYSSYFMNPLISYAAPTISNRQVGNAAISIYNKKETILFGDTVYQVLKFDTSYQFEMELTSGTYKVRSDQKYHPFPDTFPNDPDAVVNQVIEGTNYVYALKGKEYWKYQIVDEQDSRRWSVFTNKGLTSYPKPISDINSDLVGIDEAFIDPVSQDLILFKKFLYFQVNMRLPFEVQLKDTNIKWKYFQRSLVSCYDDFYKGAFGMGFKDFVKKRMPSKEAKDIPEWYSSWWTYFYIALIPICILLLIIVGVVIWFAVKENKKHSAASVKYTKQAKDGEDAEVLLNKSDHPEDEERGPESPLLPAASDDNTGSAVKRRATKGGIE